MSDVYAEIAENVKGTAHALADAVQQYIEARNKRRALKKDYQERDLPLAETENLLGNLILDLLGPNQSTKTPYGTCYKTSRANAPLADPAAFMDFVIATGEFDLLDRKANVTAVEDYIKAHDGMPPPGVNFSRVVKVGVRANSAKNGENDNGE